MAAMGKLPGLCRCVACPLWRGLIVTSRISGGEYLRQDRPAPARGYNGTGELHTYLPDPNDAGEVLKYKLCCLNRTGTAPTGSHRQRLRLVIPQYRSGLPEHTRQQLW